MYLHLGTPRLWQFCEAIRLKACPGQRNAHEHYRETSWSSQLHFFNAVLRWALIAKLSHNSIDIETDPISLLMRSWCNARMPVELSSRDNHRGLSVSVPRLRRLRRVPNLDSTFMQVTSGFRGARTSEEEENGSPDSWRHWLLWHPAPPHIGRHVSQDPSRYPLSAHVRLSPAFV